MSKHTPGPWMKSVALIARAVGIYGAMGAHVAYCETTPQTDESQRDANARLIAAAPDMLAVLYRLRQFLGDQCDWGTLDLSEEFKAWRDVEDVIAKVEDVR